MLKTTQKQNKTLTILDTINASVIHKNFYSVTQIIDLNLLFYPGKPVI